MQWARMRQRSQSVGRRRLRLDCVGHDQEWEMEEMEEMEIRKKIESVRNASSARIEEE